MTWETLFGTRPELWVLWLALTLLLFGVALGVRFLFYLAWRAGQRAQAPAAPGLRSERQRLDVVARMPWRDR